LPLRQRIPIKFGPGYKKQQIGIALLSETSTQGTAPVFGYDSSPVYANKKTGWEQHFIDSVVIQWIPSNYVGTNVFDGVSTNVTSTAISPFEAWEDIDSLEAVNFGPS
jgi:hypothetical protein